MIPIALHNIAWKRFHIGSWFCLSYSSICLVTFYIDFSAPERLPSIILLHSGAAVTLVFMTLFSLLPFFILYFNLIHMIRSTFCHCCRSLLVMYTSTCGTLCSLIFLFPFFPYTPASVILAATEVPRFVMLFPLRALCLLLTFPTSLVTAVWLSDHGMCMFKHCVCWVI